MNVVFYTLGCKVNQYETQIMRELLLEAGFTEDCTANADVVVINSCTVTAESDRKTRQAIHRFRKKNHGAVIVLAGCYPQALHEKNITIDSDADIIIGNANAPALPQLIKQFKENPVQINALKLHNACDGLGILKNGHYEGKTRAFIKIEDGCNRFCSYCMVPYARGRVRSKKLDDIKKEVSLLAENGCKEVVLTGINLTAYGSDLNEGIDLADAVLETAKVDGIKRIRLGSMEPDQLTPDIIDRLSSCKKLCGQFHISLQSGCDTTLKRMGRKYDAEFYEQLVMRLRKQFKGCAITTDIMVGFPGESDEEFEKSLEFAKKISFSRAHIFAYSPRTGTPAAAMKEQITHAKKDERSKIISLATNQSTKDFMQNLVGSEQNVLFEQMTDTDGVYEGYTENYVTVHVKSKSDISGEIKRVKILSAYDEYAAGEIAE